MQDLKIRTLQSELDKMRREYSIKGEINRYAEIGMDDLRSENDNIKAKLLMLE
jgi:hypothetical protein